MSEYKIADGKVHPTDYQTKEERAAYLAKLNERIWSKVETKAEDKEVAPTCPSCNTPYRDHLGLWGTCKKLQEIFALVEAHQDEAYYRRTTADKKLWQAVLGLKNSTGI